MEDSLKPIMVNHEWGALKEAVVGYPHFRVGRRVAFWFKSYYTQEAVEMQENWIRNFSGRTIAEFDPDLHHEQVQQVDAAIKILQDRGIIVHQVKPMQPDEEKFLENFESDSIQFYPRDPILVVGSTIIEMPLYAPFRRKERFAIRRTIGERISESNARVVCAPEPLPQNESEESGYGPGPFLEGGDVFVLGRDIYVGNSGIASNKAGIRWLQDCLGEDYRVHEVRLSRKFLHLDCVLCTPRPGLAMVCEEAFLDGLPPFLKGWQLIKVSLEDAERKLACNGLVLDENTILLAAELPELANELAKAGQTVVTTPFSAVYWQGGAFRCWHHPLVRESTLS